MIRSMLFMISVLLAGSAVAGMVTEPAARVRRLRAAGQWRLKPASRSLPTRTLEAVRAAVITPRDGSPPTEQRLALGLAAGVAVPLGLHALIGTMAVLWTAPVAALVVFVAAGHLESSAARRRRVQLIDDLPGSLDLLSAAMAAGLPLRSAVREVIAVTDGPLAEDLNGVLAGIDLGRSDADAWRSLRDHPALGSISIDMARSVRSGTMIAATLQRHAAIARSSRRGSREARARTVGVRSVPPLMLCFVPAFLLISVVPIAAAGILQALS
jgi:pilus assembly protein TadC